MKVGDIIRTKITRSDNSKVEVTGIIHGRKRVQGGWTWLIKEVKFEPEVVIGVRSVEKV